MYNFYIRWLICVESNPNSVYAVGRCPADFYKSIVAELKRAP